MMLPDKPSELIEIALQDLERVESQPDRYVVDMYRWHYTRPDGLCAVCLAGAVMTRLPGRHASPGGVEDTRLRSQLWALDCFRVGSIRSGLRYLGLSTTELREDVYVTPYHEDRDSFYADMRRMVSALRSVGL